MIERLARALCEDASDVGAQRDMLALLRRRNPDVVSAMAGGSCVSEKGEDAVIAVMGAAVAVSCGLTVWGPVVRDGWHLAALSAAPNGWEFGAVVVPRDADPELLDAMIATHRGQGRDLIVWVRQEGDAVIDPSTRRWVHMHQNLVPTIHDLGFAGRWEARGVRQGNRTVFGWGWVPDDESPIDERIAHRWIYAAYMRHMQAWNRLNSDLGRRALELNQHGTAQLSGRIGESNGLDLSKTRGEWAMDLDRAYLRGRFNVIAEGQTWVGIPPLRPMFNRGVEAMRRRAREWKASVGCAVLELRRSVWESAFVLGVASKFGVTTCERWGPDRHGSEGALRMIIEGHVLYMQFGDFVWVTGAILAAPDEMREFEPGVVPLREAVGRIKMRCQSNPCLCDSCRPVDWKASSA